MLPTHPELKLIHLLFLFCFQTSLPTLPENSSASSDDEHTLKQCSYSGSDTPVTMGGTLNGAPFPHRIVSCERSCLVSLLGDLSSIPLQLS